MDPTFHPKWPASCLDILVLPPLTQNASSKDSHVIRKVISAFLSFSLAILSIPSLLSTQFGLLWLRTHFLGLWIQPDGLSTHSILSPLDYNRCRYLKQSCEDSEKSTKAGGLGKEIKIWRTVRVISFLNFFPPYFWTELQGNLNPGTTQHVWTENTSREPLFPARGKGDREWGKSPLLFSLQSPGPAPKEAASQICTPTVVTVAWEITENQNWEKTPSFHTEELGKGSLVAQ